MSSENVREHFTKAEAEALVGKTFENIKLPNVPKGARGLVVATDYQNRNWLVVIKWELSYRRHRGQGMHRWLTKDEMQRLLREVSL